MTKISRSFIASIYLLVASCAHLESAVDAGVDAFNNKADIRYSNHKVNITYRYQGAPVRPGQSVFLGSDLHSISTEGVFVLSSDRRKLTAEIPMPRSKPASLNPACFYISVDNHSSGNIIPVKDKPGHFGFYNPYWENAIANPAQLKALNAENAQLTKEKHQLKGQLVNVKRSLSQSPAYLDGQCTLPKQGSAHPVSPFGENFQKNIEMMPYAICSDLSAAGLEPGSGIYLLNPEDRAAIRENSAAFQQAQRQLATESKTASLGTFYRSILDDTEKKLLKVSSCTALSKCKTYDELFFGSPFRNYGKAFSNCKAKVLTEITQRTAKYDKAYKEWIAWPQKQKDSCEELLRFSNSAPQRIESIDLQLQQNMDVKRELDAKPKSKGSVYLRRATETTCDI